MQKFIVNRKHLGFSHCSQGDSKISQSQARIDKAWLNEVDVCERLLVYILVIFVLIYVHFPCFYLIFEFFVWFTLLIP